MRKHCHTNFYLRCGCGLPLHPSAGRLSVRGCDDGEAGFIEIIRADNASAPRLGVSPIYLRGFLNPCWPNDRDWCIYSMWPSLSISLVAKQEFERG